MRVIVNKFVTEEQLRSSPEWLKVSLGILAFALEGLAFLIVFM